jgi:uncharacterized lipoprotein YddW (UPF0748 family)
MYSAFGCIAAVLVAAGEAGSAPEIRAIWAHVSQLDADADKGKAQVRQWAERFARARLNIVYPWVESSYLAAVEDSRLLPGVPNAKWDALGVLVRECANLGMQVHPWYSFTYYKGGSSPEFLAHPDCRAVRLDELVPDPKTNRLHPARWSDVCPSHPEGREFQIRLLERMLDRYPQMSGIHVEEPGFGYRDNCFCPLCQELFRKLYGFDQKQAPNGDEATELKTLGTTAFVRVLRQRLLKRNPLLVLTANGGYDWREERVLGRDWARWAGCGWLDGYAAQIYVYRPELLAQRARLVVSDLGAHCQVTIGINISPPATRPVLLKPDEVCQMVHVIRQSGAEGIALFHAGLLSDEYAAALAAGPFAQPATPPKPRRLAATAGR